METNISIMTFNVRCSIADDKDNSWSYRKPITLETIQKYKPDLLGLQECFMEQADYLIPNLPLYYYYGIGREKNGLGEMEGEFYSKILFTPVEMGTFWLSETPHVPGSISWGAACARTATWMKVRHFPTDKYFYWFNTHFDHKSEVARQSAAKTLIKKINTMTGSLPVIVTGDFNSSEGSAAWKILTEGDFKDAWLIADNISGPEVTYHDFMKKNIKGKDRIDWIMVKGIKKVKNCETIVYNNNSKYPSDHFPVYAEITM